MKSKNTYFEKIPNLSYEDYKKHLDKLRAMKEEYLRIKIAKNFHYTEWRKNVKLERETLEKVLNLIPKKW